MTLTRNEILAIAKVNHDAECSCDPKYLMSCAVMAQKILEAGSINRQLRQEAKKVERVPVTTIDEVVWQCDADSRLWFPKVYAFSDMESLAHHTLSQAGEAGEVANKVKKAWRDLGRASFTELEPERRADILEENMDVFIYNMNIFALLGIANPIPLYNQKRAFNAERFGRKGSGQ